MWASLRHSEIVSYIVLICELWKENLNSDGQQFHPYQQNEHPTLDLKSLNTNKKTTTYMYHVGNLGSGLGQTQQCGGVRPINGIAPLLKYINPD